MRRFLKFSLGCAALAALVVPAAAMAGGSGGVSGPSFYVDGSLYRTVGTPTDLSNTGAPDSSFETIYDFGGVQPNVAEAGPGQPGLRGGPRLRGHRVGGGRQVGELGGSGCVDPDAPLALADSLERGGDARRVPARSR